MPQPRIVACPTCAAPVTWSEASPSRPFCSERCKLMDLAAWASERYSLPVEKNSDEDIEGDPSAPRLPFGS